MPTFERDGLSFHYLDRGEGLPFVFQHGLGGDLSQPFGLYTPPAGVRLIGFDARAHGQTRPLGDVHQVAIAPFADDLVALLDHLGVSRAVLGGISLGAAVALNAAVRHPRRTLGLVLVRPAWLDRPLPENARPFAHVAQYLLKFGASARATVRFLASDRIPGDSWPSRPTWRSRSRGQFLDPRAARSASSRLERLPPDCPPRPTARSGRRWRPRPDPRPRHPPRPDPPLGVCRDPCPAHPRRPARRAHPQVGEPRPTRRRPSEGDRRLSEPTFPRRRPVGGFRNVGHALACRGRQACPTLAPLPAPKSGG